MAPKKELCRNFLLGSCRYGDRCKFLHAAQTPSKSNPFGFGVQNGNQFQQSNRQQQNPNPFGFGMQNSNQSQNTNLQQQRSNPFGFGKNSSQSKGGASDFGSRQNQFKWTRPSQTNAGGSSAPRQSDNQSAAHKCTDPESCKSQIAEDLQNERPLWKLTCYGHSKNGPCDIVGDISYEELRAVAYDDAKRGLSMQAIVERERNLLNSKLMEFNNLNHNPYKIPLNSGIQSPFHSMQNTPVIAESNNPPSFSSFSHLGTTITGGPTASPPSLFGQHNPFQNTIPTLRSFGSELPSQTIQSPFGSSSTGFSNSSIGPLQQQNSSSTSDLFSGSYSGDVITNSTHLELNNTTPVDNLDGDDSIWTSEKWTIGKIPESVPPAKYIR